MQPGGEQEGNPTAGKPRSPHWRSFEVRDRGLRARSAEPTCAEPLPIACLRRWHRRAAATKAPTAVEMLKLPAPITPGATGVNQAHEWPADKAGHGLAQHLGHCRQFDAAPTPLARRGGQPRTVQARRFQFWPSIQPSASARGPLTRPHRIHPPEAVSSRAGPAVDGAVERAVAWGHRVGGLESRRSVDKRIRLSGPA